MVRVEETTDRILRCAFLVASGDSGITPEEGGRLGQLPGEIRRMVEAQKAIEICESTGDLDLAREHFDPETPITYSLFSDERRAQAALEGLFDERAAVQSADALAQLVRRVAGEIEGLFLQRIAYICSIQVAEADENMTPGEQYCLDVMSEEWGLSEEDIIDWYRRYAVPILTGEPVSEADASGERSLDEILADLTSLLEDGNGSAAVQEEEETLPPLFVAVRQGDLSSFKEARRTHPEGINDLFQGISLVSYAILYEQFEIAEALLQSGGIMNPSVDAQSSPLLLAVQNQQESSVRFCLDHGADPNLAVSILVAGDGGDELSVGGIAALHVAAQQGDEQLVRLLLAKGADGNAMDGLGFTPLMHAIKNGHQAVAKLLIGAGAKLDFDPPSSLPANHLARLNPLLVSATNANLPMARFLLGKRVRVDVVDGNGSTALKHAAASGDRAMVTALLKAGADVNLSDDEGWTPLMSAAYREHLPVVRALLAHGANPDIQTTVENEETSGWTPLIAAAAYACRGIVEALIEAKADVGVRGGDGLTALQHATQKASSAASAEQRRAFKRTAELLLDAEPDTARDLSASPPR